MEKILEDEQNMVIDTALQLVLRITYEIARLRDICGNPIALFSQDHKREVERRLDVAHEHCIAAQKVLAPF